MSHSPSAGYRRGGPGARAVVAVAKRPTLIAAADPDEPHERTTAVCRHEP